jgi:hypothetical protein
VDEELNRPTKEEQYKIYLKCFENIYNTSEQYLIVSDSTYFNDAEILQRLEFMAFTTMDVD